MSLPYDSVLFVDNHFTHKSQVPFYILVHLALHFNRTLYHNITYSGDGTGGVETGAESVIFGAVVAVAFADVLLFPILRKMPMLSLLLKSYTM